MSGLKQSRELGDDLTFAGNADGLLFFRATLEVNQRRDAADAELCRDARSIVDIHFGDMKFARIFSGDLLNHRAKHAAGGAPWSPEVNQHRTGGCSDEGFEV